MHHVQHGINDDKGACAPYARTVARQQVSPEWPAGLMGAYRQGVAQAGALSSGQ